MNRRLDRIKQDSAKADEAIAQLIASGELKGETPNPATLETAASTDSTPEQPVATETDSANESKEPQAEMVPESKYKSAVKAMNAAQKERAEFEKTLKEILEQNETIKRELEVIKNQKKEVTSEDADELSKLFNFDNDEVTLWEDEFPKTAKIAEKKASQVKQELDSNIKNVQKELADMKAEIEEKKLREQIAQRDNQIKERHPDFDDVRLSEEFKEWIYNSAPSMYKGVYEGTIPFGVDDVIKVFDDYKASTKKQPSQPVAKKVASAEMPVKTAPTVSADMVLGNIDEFTEADFNRLSQNIHRVKDHAKRAELMKKAEAYFQKQFKTKT